MTTPSSPAKAAVLSGGGEMGALMRAKDWSTTPLGPVEEWPQSLRTAVSILLDSRFGMYIAWGPRYAPVALPRMTSSNIGPMMSQLSANVVEARATSKSAFSRSRTARSASSTASSAVCT